MTSPFPRHDPSYHRAGGAGRHSRRRARARALRARRRRSPIASSTTSRRSSTASASEIKLVLTALACDGHVLLEDVPGTAKTVLARAIAGSIEGAIPQRIQCTPDLQPTDVTGLSVFDQQSRGLRVPARADLRQRRPRRRDQPRDAEDPVGAARGDGRAPGDRRRRDARAAVPVPPARDREPDRVRGDVPAAGGAARPLLPAHGARLSGVSRTSSGSSTTSATRIRSRASSPSSGSTRCTSSAQRPSTSTSTTSSTAGSSSSCARRASRSPSSSAAPCAAASRSSEPPAHGRSSTAGATSSPRTSSGSSSRCSCTASCSRPRFVARARAGGWPEAIEEFRPSCLELAPRPGSEEDPLFEGGRSDPPGLTRAGPRAGRSADLSARPAPPRDRAVVRDDEEPAPRLGHRCRRLASVPAGRRHRRDRLGRVGAAVDRARAATSSSSASASPRRRRGSSSSATDVRRCRASRRRCPGSTSRTRCGPSSS